MSEQTIQPPSLRTVPDDVLLKVFNDWDGCSEVDLPGTSDGEEVFWELFRRGIAPSI